jgi:hypothetical protein
VNQIVLYAEDGENLCCPWCNEPNGIHLDAVVMGARLRGDDFDGMTVEVNNRGEITNRFVLESDMPGRRHYVDLRFWCEFCDAGTIRLLQHKGQTHVSYR